MPDLRAPLLSVKDLQAWYGESHILHGVSFDVHQGEVVTLLGRNGAGKTTTLKSIMGIIGQRTGSVRFEARELIGLASNQIARAGIALCPEERGIFASLTVEENLMLPPVVKQGGLPLEGIFELFPNLKERLGSSCPAASSRCWRSRGSCGPALGFCCSMSRPRALPPSSSSRSARPSAP